MTDPEPHAPEGAGNAPLLAYEDFHEGRTFALGPMTVSSEEIVSFATEFDPQPMHVDAEAAEASLLGGLAASGWHMTALLMRMMADSFVLRSAAEGAPGVDTVSWERPLLAGDRIAGTSMVTGRRPSRSRPHIGIVALAHTVTNQRDEVVMRCAHSMMIRRRGDGEAE
ncbi:MaoC family dehydratase [Pararhizobium mangrovi]|uniref:MaoC family dehydratase n=1 Tax=Pararhizobium mangrovi TaxID=2590452 RepID=A0A506UC01_9HYPH|nr:MaoC family dehydratase [Pararhizobium mangrovi]TPW29307.1 MaoC family dehydratase [Pararhizobium mangrovi]